MKELKYELIKRENIPKRTFKRKSKFDPILDEFLKMNAKICEVTVNQPAGYIRAELKNRILRREIRGIRATIANGRLFLVREEKE